MRILLINQFYIPDVAATGQLLADVAEELAAQSHEVHVICSRGNYSGGKSIDRRGSNGIQVHRVHATSFGRSRMFGRIIDYFSFYILAMWKALRLPKMDICVSLTTPPLISLIGFVLTKLKGTQSIIWVMDVYPEIAAVYGVIRKNGLVYRILSRLNKILYRNASAVISLGESMTEKLQSLGVPGDSLYTIHNWVPGETVGR
jgi:colanic acid biosynthesis glycosyl transferase WcaI